MTRQLSRLLVELEAFWQHVPHFPAALSAALLGCPLGKLRPGCECHVVLSRGTGSAKCPAELKSQRKTPGGS